MEFITGTILGFVIGCFFTLSMMQGLRLWIGRQLALAGRKWGELNEYSAVLVHEMEHLEAEVERLVNLELEKRGIE